MIVTGNYGEAGAIDIYGSRLGLPEAPSGQLSLWFWKPTHVAASSLLTVGFAPDELRFVCGAVTEVGTVVMPYSVSNQEQGTPILVCTNLKESLDAAWPAFRHFA